MEINDLKELAFAFADKAAQKNLAKLAVKTDEFSITVETHAPVAAAAAVSTAPAAEVAVQQAEKPEEQFDGTVVFAPLVGTFYAANAPEEPPLVEVGDSVRKGQTLCIIEAMKTMNTIECPCDGKVSRVLVQNGDLVEYNQPLIVIA
ncbi:acetyl-CoA carboxylase biotin carboxyl carrier protein [Butyricicoccus sp.]|uniref:acetyl-CoA carboxylase biotin carboxyl carrier protein n=1 Tax=Butyricicoccus sp. TaxID=2049021 RepID=UPI003736EB38